MKKNINKQIYNTNHTTTSEPFQFLPLTVEPVRCSSDIHKHKSVLILSFERFDQQRRVIKRCQTPEGAAG